MAKSRLRALTTQNSSVTPKFSDLKNKNLKKSWKDWYTLFISTVNQKNQKMLSFVLGDSKLGVEPHNNTRKLVYINNLSSCLFKNDRNFFFTKKFLTNVKVLFLNDKVFVTLLHYSKKTILSNFKKKKLRKKKTFKRRYSI